MKGLLTCVVLILFVGTRLSASSSLSSSVKNNVIEREETLDDLGNFHVKWTVDLDKNDIEFTVTAKTRGYVGFGISPTGGMAGADIFICGVNNDGTTYASDRHGLKVSDAFPQFTAVEDDSRDWFLLEGRETGEYTIVKFRRILNPCDTDDIHITADSLKFIWALGQEDIIGYHGSGSENRGSQTVFALDPPQPPLDLTQFEHFNFTWTLPMPEDHTTYWCKVFKDPTSFTQKQHIVAFKPILESKIAKDHTHHFVIYKCRAPPGQNPEEFFDKYTDAQGNNGGQCFLPKDQQVVPYEHCLIFTYDWSVGGRTFIFPEHVGLPLGESTIPDYYMFEIHLDNPDKLAGVNVSSGVQIFYTDKLREQDAALLRVSYDIIPSHTIPPNSKNFVTVGHCSAGCSNKMSSRTGLNVFTVNIHAHISGRKIKIRHFRNGTELPWIINNENYDFDYQDNRPLRDEVKILPGDHLSLECTYDTTWKNDNTVVIGGWSTREEMCESFLYYYPRDALADCKSGYPNDIIYKRFGIDEVAQEFGEFDPRVILPKEYFDRNMTYSDVLNEQVWTDDMKELFQHEMMFGLQDDTCSVNQSHVPFMARQNEGSWNYVTYPKHDKPYAPERICRNSNDTGHGSRFLAWSPLLFLFISVSINRYF